MIQRIQTIYLFLVALLMSTLFFVDIIDFGNENTAYTMQAAGIYSVGEGAQLLYPIWALFAMLVITTILPIITIFQYKKRSLQMRFCIFNGVLIFFFYGVLGFYCWLYAKELAVSAAPQFSIVVPLVSLLLNYIAFKRIARDDVLVRSADRLR